ncbi:MAG TPA: PqqD family protein [Gemmatimonadaceae bacterium]|jgi:Coenzyme PQQ synthesis protein D (PqqD).
MLFGKSNHSHASSGSSERFTPEPHVVSVVQDTDTALLDVRSERYFTLNEVGTRIWELLAEGTEVAVIAELLAEEYDAPIDAIAADTRTLLTALEKARLVRRV